MERPETIVIDLESLQRTGQGPISGGLWFCAASPFPEAGWYDFPAVLLAQWLVVLRSLSAGVSTVGTLRFRDGPYGIRASVIDDQRLSMEFVEFRTNRTIVSGSATFALPLVVEEAVSAARSVLAACTAKGWRSEDLERLRIEAR